MFFVTLKTKDWNFSTVLSRSRLVGGGKLLSCCCRDHSGQETLRVV